MSELPTPKIKITDLSKSFDMNPILKGIDLSIYPGEALVIIGESGSGKTLLLKCIAGLIKPDSGSIKLNAIETIGLQGNARDDIISRFGMLFQQAALFDSLPIWRNVAFKKLEQDKLGIKEARSIAEKKLKAVGISKENGTLLPAEISGGMQKRVGLARAIADDPEILLLDEPTSGLDPITTQVICNLLVDNVNRLGATAITVTSDINAAMSIANRIIMLHEGKIEWSGPKDELPKTRNKIVARFVRKWKVEQAAM